MKSSVGKGAFVLVISGLICKSFGAFFRLPLTNIVGIEGIGIFQMLMSLYSLALILVSGGVTSGLTKLISSARARGENKKIGGYLKQASIFGLLLSAVLGLIFILFSSSIASFQKAPQSNTTYMLFAVLLPLGAMIGVLRGIVQGYENMNPTALSQIIEQIFKFIFGLLFAYIFGKKGVSQGVFGAFLGICISEIIAFCYLAVEVFRKRKIKFEKIIDSQGFLKAVLPLTFSSAIFPLTVAIEGIVIIMLLTKAGLDSEISKELYGVQTGVVGAILNFPLIISISVSTAVLPKLSFLSSKNDLEGQRYILKNSFHIMWFILIPIVIGIISISPLLYPLIYPKVIKNYLETALQLTVFGGISIILTAIMQFLIASLQAKGYFSYALVFNACGGTFKVLTTILFASLPQINIYALPLSSIVHSCIVCVCSLIKLRPLIKISIFEFSLPVLASTIMFLILNIFIKYLHGIIGLFILIFSGAIIYLILAFPLCLSYGKIFINQYRKANKN